MALPQAECCQASGLIHEILDDPIYLNARGLGFRGVMFLGSCTILFMNSRVWGLVFHAFLVPAPKPYALTLYPEPETLNP